MTVRRKMFIVVALYFAEGFPFGFIWDTLPVYFRLQGLSLQEIGLMSLVSLPWTLKFLWAPGVDRSGETRAWILWTQLLMGGFLMAAGMVLPLDMGLFLWPWLLGLALLSATQDIAVDGYSIRILDEREMGMANGLRVSSYRVALIAAGGLLVALGGAVGWHGAFLLAGAVLFLCGGFSCTLPPSAVGHHSTGLGEMVAPLWALLKRPGAPWVALFILLYKLGDMAMGPMVRPFWVDRGLTTGEIGFITGTGGIAAGIAGALAGGAWTSRFGIFHGLWFMGIWQAVSNLGYGLAAHYPQSGHLGVYGASLVESFCGGLGTAPFLAFLMIICRKDMAATQYALLSALFGLARSLSGAASGWFASHLGYGTYFFITFFLAVPAFLLLPAVKAWVPAPDAAPVGNKDADLRS
jgi:MFS transporter, PAT family, beta-lactamase induction signal transducer AmpG